MDLGGYFIQSEVSQKLDMFAVWEHGSQWLIDIELILIGCEFIGFLISENSHIVDEEQRSKVFHINSQNVRNTLNSHHWVTSLFLMQNIKQCEDVIELFNIVPEFREQLSHALSGQVVIKAQLNQHFQELHLLFSRSLIPHSDYSNQWFNVLVWFLFWYFLTTACKYWALQVYHRMRDVQMLLSLYVAFEIK